MSNIEVEYYFHKETQCFHINEGIMKAGCKLPMKSERALSMNNLVTLEEFLSSFFSQIQHTQSFTQHRMCLFLAYELTLTLALMYALVCN